MDAAALPAAALEHPAHGLGQSDVGIGGHQPHARQAALFEAAQELTPQELTLAVTHLQAEQLTAAVSMDAPSTRLSSDRAASGEGPGEAGWP
jgi:hypothetical protein